ncbi:MAG: hypothetical protein IPK44_04640 [Candidatus Accumulibacter sp.]|jgi:hypothetical protein|uniref:hypothetical protein n=1 Tax=Accumulibacter sp. TaxID=2053492 RepID=UPI00258C167E|nr:hypothetical protein [Accumulibacter sp.]MBK8113875.1 hypothetical protein [Accumulibacter sp.]
MRLIVQFTVAVFLAGTQMTASAISFGGLDTETIRARISDLNPPDKGLPENEFSLNDERRAVDNEISELRGISQRTVDRTKDIEVIDKAKTAISSAISAITKADCQKLADGKFVFGGQIIDQLQLVERRNFRLDLEDEPSPWMDHTAPYRDRNEAKISDQEACTIWKKFVGSSEKQAALLSYFDNLKIRLTDQSKKSVEAKTLSAQLLDILQKRKDAIEKKLTTQSTKTELTDKLWIVIGVIGFLSIGAILAVKVFDEPIQIEWVASGQVIQFVTVMILLSVIMALGLAGILRENTLGTLLGGVAGYVLAQGVGRAAAREATRDRIERHDGQPVVAGDALQAPRP